MLGVKWFFVRKLLWLKTCHILFNDLRPSKKKVRKTFLYLSSFALIKPLTFHNVRRKNCQINPRFQSQEKTCFKMYQTEISSLAFIKLRPHQASGKREARHPVSKKIWLQKKNHLQCRTYGSCITRNESQTINNI